MKRKTLIALAIAAAFAAPLAYADSDMEKTSQGSLISAFGSTTQGLQDLIRGPKSVLIAETEDREGTDEKADLIAEGDDKEKGEKADLIAEGEDKEGTEKADLIA